MTSGLFKLILLASVLTVTQLTVVCGVKCHNCNGDRHDCGMTSNAVVECPTKPYISKHTGEPEIDHNYAGPPSVCYMSYWSVKINETLSSSNDIQITRGCEFPATGKDGKKISPGCHDASKMSPFPHDIKQSSGMCLCATDLCNSAEFK